MLFLSLTILYSLCFSLSSHCPNLTIRGTSAQGLYTLLSVPNAFTITLVKISHAFGGGFGSPGHSSFYSFLHWPIILPGGMTFPFMFARSDIIIILRYTRHMLVSSNWYCVMSWIDMTFPMILMSFTRCFLGYHIFSMYIDAFNHLNRSLTAIIHVPSMYLTGVSTCSIIGCSMPAINCVDLMLTLMTFVMSLFHLSCLIM